VNGADTEVISDSGAIPRTEVPTTTTTPYCFEDSVSWEPLDMEGTTASNEENAFACQQKCYDTDGCYHFSYWQKWGTCHLQDAFALRRDYQADYTSGPFQCWSYLQDSGLVKVGVQQFLPKQFSCMQVGQSWDPVMQWRSGHVLAGGQADQIMECQALCASTPKCAHFTMDVETRTCKLASDTASLVSGILHSISGPPSCDTTKQEQYFMRKFIAGEVQLLFGSYTAAAVAAIGLAALGAFAAFVVRTRSQNQRSLELPSEAIDEAMIEEAE